MSIFKRVSRFFIPFMPAWLVTFAFASIFHTSSVLHNLRQLDISIPWHTWLKTMVQDFLGLLPTYGVILAVALCLGFLVTSMLIRAIHKPGGTLVPIVRCSLFCVSGGMAIAVTLLAMQPILNVTLIAGARGTVGFGLQCIAGMIGGVVFVFMGGGKPNI